MTVYASDEELLKILDALALSTDPMFAINERHRIVFWNKPLQHLLGWSYDDVVGRSCGGVLAGMDDFGNRYCSDDCPIIAITRRGDAVRQFRLRARAKEGAPVPIEISVVKFALRTANHVLLVHIVRRAEAIAEAAPVPQRTRDVRVRNLTAREMEILTLLSSGQSTREIAQRLGIAPLTARNHMRNMFEKLEVHSKTEAVSFAYKMHVV